MKAFFDNRLETISQGVSSHKCKCAWCNSIVSPNKGLSINDKNNYRIGYIYVCPNCGEIILYNRIYNEVFPQAKFGDSFSKLPKDVNKIYEECRDCYSVGAYTSVLLLARKLLMHIAVDCSAEEDKSFAEYVNYLDENHFVPPNSRSLLDFIRKQGNEPNHQIVIKTKEDAEKILKFMSIILTFVYEFADEQGGANGK